MDFNNLIAIDIHTHAEVSCWNPFDNYGEEYDRAADKYFRNSRRPTITETIAYYRERRIGLVMFTVDAETQLGRRRIPNEEIAEAAQKNSDMMIAFASIDPHKGKMGAREALSGSDYPLITPDRWMKDLEDAGFRPEVMPGILKDNAVRLLALDAA